MSGGVPTDPPNLVDLVVVGAGPAGLAAAIMVRRDGRDPLVLERGHAGGALRTARWVENYPGYPQGVEGGELAARIVEQAHGFGVEITAGEVLEIAPAEAHFRVILAGGEVAARAVICAPGSRPRTLGVPGEAAARGVRLFATVAEIEELGGADLGGRTLAVIGGGDVALDQALALQDRGARVRVLHRSAELRAAPHLVEQVRRAGVELRTGCRVTGCELTAHGLCLALTSAERDVEETVHAALACLGREADASLLPAAAGDPREANAWGQTALAGLYVAGDLRRGPDRHTAIAVGDGQAAALDALRYLRGRI